MVLALLAVGSLTIAANLGYASTNLKGVRVAMEDAKGVYAASSGIEQALWAYSSNVTPATSTPENINGMAVSINATKGSEVYTLFLDGLATGVHVNWTTTSSTLTRVSGNTFLYTITIYVASNVNNKSLDEFGAVLPSGYIYEQGSAADYPTNLSKQGNPAYNDPPYTGNNTVGAQWIKWAWSNHQPGVTGNTTYTQKFRIIGTGPTGGCYSWAHGGSQDIGLVGEATGAMSTIIATARRPQDGKITGKVTATAIVSGSNVYLFTWQITK
jgi:hypothetical protein